MHSSEKRHSRNWLRASKAEGARVLSYPIFFGFRSWKEILKNAFFKNVSVRVRASVRPSRRPALESVNFASPKMWGSKKRHSIIATIFTFKSVGFASQKGLRQKSLPPVKVCEIRNGHIFPAVSPQRGLTSTEFYPSHVPHEHLSRMQHHHSMCIIITWFLWTYLMVIQFYSHVRYMNHVRLYEHEAWTR